MVEVEDLTFSFSDVMQIVTGAVALEGAWFYLKRQFNLNGERLAHVETSITSQNKTLEDMDGKLDGVVTSINDTARAVIEIKARGDVLEERFKALATPRLA